MERARAGVTGPGPVRLARHFLARPAPVLEPPAQSRRGGAGVQSAPADGPVLHPPQPPQGDHHRWHQTASSRACASRIAGRAAEVSSHGATPASRSKARWWPISTRPLPKAGREPEARSKRAILLDPQDIPPAGDVSARVICGEPGMFRTYRFDQFVASMAQRNLWLTDAYFVATTSYVQALGRGGARRRRRAPAGARLQRRAGPAADRSGGLSLAGRGRASGCSSGTAR